MTRREAKRQWDQENTLINLGFTQAEAASLRRISMTLHRWHELECGTDRGCIERDEQTGRAYWRNAMNGNRQSFPDRETAALKRLAAILKARNDRVTRLPVLTDEDATNRRPGADESDRTEAQKLALTAYVQTDPRGAALYILRPGDIPEGGFVESYYNCGLCVY
jgi:hypothetical protein